LFTLNLTIRLFHLQAACLLTGIPGSKAEQSAEQKDLLNRVVKAFTEPRANKENDESVMKPIYEVLSPQMNSSIKIAREKVYIDKNGEECYGTTAERKVPIVALTYMGKAKLHLCCVADTLTVAQEVWILLHLARCYYNHFESNLEPKDVPVTPQPIKPGKGNSGTYTQKDVDFFRATYKKVEKARNAEKQKLQDGTMEASDRFCYWNFEEEARKAAEKAAKDKANGVGEKNDGDNYSDPGSEVEDDSVGGDDIEF
jgi:hypothetical protein